MILVIREREVDKTNLERDLGVIVANDLKWSEHVDRMVGKENRMLGMLKKTFESRDPKLWKELYISLVRPHWEFALPVWNPHLKGDIEELENIQHRGDKACARLKKKVEYMERLRKVRLTRLETAGGHLIQFFKVVYVLDHVNMETRSRKSSSRWFK